MDSFYIFNPANPFLAPAAYPVGFPLILAPIYWLAGNSIFAFLIYINLLLICSTLLFYRLLSRSFNSMFAGLVCLIFAYNPWILSFKGEVIADIPFALFFLLNCLLYLKAKSNAKLKYYVIFGLVAGFSMLIKNIGLVLILGAFADGILEQIIWIIKKEQHHKPLKTRVKNLGTALLSAAGCYFLFSKLLFPTDIETVGFFSSLFDFQNLSEIWSRTLVYYKDAFIGFFEVGRLGKLQWLLACIALWSLPLGGALLMFKRQYFLALTTLGYLLIVLSFPNTTQGFRYLLPIFPLLLFILLQPIRLIPSIPVWAKLGIVTVFTFLFGLAYADGIQFHSKSKTIKGPQQAEAQQLFNFAASTDNSSVFVFVKPRVFGLYASRYSYCNNRALEETNTAKELNNLGYDYLVLHKEIVNPALERFIEENQDQLSVSFKNDLFIVYSRLQSDSIFSINHSPKIE